MKLSETILIAAFFAVMIAATPGILAKAQIEYETVRDMGR